MSSVFIIQNSEGLFLSRQGEWVGSDEASSLFKSPHQDQAINELFEASSRHITLRAKVVSANTSSRGVPLVSELAAPKFSNTEPQSIVEKPAGQALGDAAQDEAAPASERLETSSIDAPSHSLE